MYNNDIKQEIWIFKKQTKKDTPNISTFKN